MRRRSNPSGPVARPGESAHCPGQTVRAPRCCTQLLAATLLVLLPLALTTPARATADLQILSLPAGFMADNATEASVLCSITNGYPDNLYAVKGTFSGGDLPYYGLTYAAQTTMWASQTGSWNGAQMKIQTDAHGAWKGYIAMRLESTAPRGDILYRFSAIPIRPISLPGPTVSDWLPTLSLDPLTTGGWLCGHVYRDAACTVPASSVVVEARDVFGRVLGAYVSQNAFVVDGEDRTDTGFIRIGVPRGRVASLAGRARVATTDATAGAPVPLFTRTTGPWIVRPGATVSFDVAWGDADGDGALTAADAVLAAQLAAGLCPPDPAACRRADAWPDAPDGKVTLEDATALLRQLGG